MYVDINCKKSLWEKEKEISQLFLESFGRTLSIDEWRWFYIDNPIGDPYVTLFYENQKLLGHYAVLPTLLNYRGKSFVAYRSMTTMVHPDGRGKGLFTEMAKRVYSTLKADNASLVYGFPNANSAPGFIRNLGWTLLAPDHVCDFNGGEILENNLLQDALLQQADIEWDSGDGRQASWRHAMPGARVTSSLGLVTKEYHGILNILHIAREGLSAIDAHQNYRVLISRDYLEKTGPNASSFDYQFGYRVFDESFNKVDFRRELIMSDVF